MALPVPKFSTEQLADQLHIKPQSLRSALCRDGHYFGIRPTKLQNGRLLWPADAVEQLTARTAYPQSRKQRNGTEVAHA